MEPVAKKVLIVEDEEKISLVLKDLLQKSGFEALQAFSGETGVEVALKEKPDLILLDLRLPGMSGMGFLEALRKDAWGKSAAVVVLTNDQTPESLKATQELGVKEYMMKSNWSAKEALNRALTFIGEKVE